MSIPPSAGRGHSAQLTPGRALSLLAGGAVLLSAAPVLVKVADVGPSAAAFYRMLFGGVGLTLLAVLTGRRLWSGLRSLILAAACAVFFALDLVLWHTSIHLVGPGVATILANFQALILGAYGVLVLRERPTARLVVAIPVALAGLALLFGLDWRALEPARRAGVAFGLLTAVAYATYLLLLRRARAEAEGVTALATVAVISLCCTALLAVASPLQGESLAVPNARTWIVLAAYGFVPQMLGWVLVTRGIAAVPASRAGLVLLLQPSLAFVWDVLLFARPTSAREAAGAALALGAIYLGTTKLQ